MEATSAFEAFDRAELWDKYEHYFAIYDRFLRSLQGQKVQILEIGVDRGGSLAAWREFFGADLPEYYGLDINPDCKRFEHPGVTVLAGDQGDKTYVERLAKELPDLNLVIDDGRDVANQQITSFEAFFPNLVSGGIYIVEDTHTSFWSDYRSIILVRGAPREVGVIEYSAR